MTEASLSLQIALRDRLIGSPSLAALVPAARITDRSARPEVFPCIILGDGQTILEGISLDRRHVRVYLDLHIWQKETGLASVKTIAGVARAALLDHPTVEGYRVLDCFVSGTRFLRDPAGEHGHAVLTVEALLAEEAGE